MTNPPRHLVLASLLMAASLLLSTRRVSGQEPQGAPNAAPGALADSLPFRAGQWGAEFAINDGTIGLGVLRFRSARKAWVLDAAVGFSWSETESPSLGEYSSSGLLVRLRAGPRRYRPIATGTAAYVGMGLTGAYGRTTNGDVRSRLWDAGVFGELGGVYFVTRRLSLGAQVELNATFSYARQSASSYSAAARDRRASIGVSPVRIVGALYF